MHCSLKRDMVARLAQLSREYTHAVDVKMSKQAKRMMRENAAATSQLTMLSDHATQLLRDHERAEHSESQIKMRLSMMESLEHDWAKRLRTNARVITNKRLVLYTLYKASKQKWRIKERIKCKFDKH